jgi:hypothetical protein
VKASVATNVTVLRPLQTELWTADWLNFRLRKVETEDIQLTRKGRFRKCGCGIGVFSYGTNTLHNVPFTDYYLPYGTPNWNFLVNTNFVPKVLFILKMDWERFVVRFFFKLPKMKEWRKQKTQKTHFCSIFPEFNLTDTKWMYIVADCCSERDKVTVMLSILRYRIFSVQILYKLFSLQLNCTYSNYTQAAATCSAAQQHSTFTVQVLYKLYSLQLNCT